MVETTLKYLGVDDTLSTACRGVNWTHSTSNQRQILKEILAGGDVVYVGKRRLRLIAPFAVGITQCLARSRSAIAFVLTPICEVATNIAEQFEMLTTGFNINVVTDLHVLYDETKPLNLQKSGLIIIATRAGLINHINGLNNFDFRLLQFLVIYDAHLMSSANFDRAFEEIIRIFPDDRQNIYISEEVTPFVEKLKLALQHPVTIIASKTRFTAVDPQHFYTVAESTSRETHLIYLLNHLKDLTFVIFVNSVDHATSFYDVLHRLGVDAILLCNLSESGSGEVLNAKSDTGRKIYIVTDDTIRNYDIRNVGVIVNLHIPSSLNNLNHRLATTKDVEMSITVMKYCDCVIHSWITDYIENKCNILSFVEFVDEELTTTEEQVLRARALISQEKTRKLATKKRCRTNADDVISHDNCKRMRFNYQHGSLLNSPYVTVDKNFNLDLELFDDNDNEKPNEECTDILHIESINIRDNEDGDVNREIEIENYTETVVDEE